MRINQGDAASRFGLRFLTKHRQQQYSAFEGGPPDTLNYETERKGEGLHTERGVLKALQSIDNEEPLEIKAN